MSDKQIKFLPFHAINEFMIPEYRLKVLQSVFSGMDQYEPEKKNQLNGLVKKYVQIQGFRNPTLAPGGMKARQSVSVFERSPEFTARVLQAWSENRPELREKVFAFLTERQMKMLPMDVDRTKLPGFFATWPKDLAFDVLTQEFKAAHPELADSDDDICLMAVWMTGRLPFELVDQVEEDLDADEETGA